MVSHDARIARAELLAERRPGAADLLRFYAGIVRFQRTVFEGLRTSNETDLSAVTNSFPPLAELVSRTGPPLIANFPGHNPQSREELLSLLSAAWQGDEPADPAARFFARTLLQPYAEYLASRGDISEIHAGSTCPFCNARPVAGVLRGEGEGGKRWLLCSLCSTEWQYRRVLCPNCGEENKDRLPIYTTDDFPAARIDACDTCKTYIKSIDLTKDGHAIPVVDEIATVTLNIWAEEHGYAKLETNLLGM